MEWATDERESLLCTRFKKSVLRSGVLTGFDVIGVDEAAVLDAVGKPGLDIGGGV